jgi:hypothetical protein
MKLVKYLLVVLFLAGCDVETKGNIVENKSEYSVLQAYEYQYRGTTNDKSYMIFKRALDTEFTVVAFPRKDSSQGYVMMLANDEETAAVKLIPQTDFLVTQEVFAKVKSEILLSKKLEQFIAGQISIPNEHTNKR